MSDHHSDIHPVPAAQPFIIFPPLPEECDLSSYSDRERNHILVNWKYSHSKLTSKIQFAARWGFIAYLDKLVQENEVDLNESGALYQAALGNRFEMVKHLVERHHVDVNYFKPYSLSDLPLNGAISSLNATGVGYLLSKGASLVLKGEYSRNALEHCVDKIDLSIKLEERIVLVLRELIKAGSSSDVDISFDGMSPTAYLKKLQKKYPETSAYIATILPEVADSKDLEPSVHRKRPGR